MSFLDSLFARFGYVPIAELKRRERILIEQLRLSSELLKKAVQANKPKPTK